MSEMDRTIVGKNTKAIHSYHSIQLIQVSTKRAVILAHKRQWQMSTWIQDKMHKMNFENRKSIIMKTFYSYPQFLRNNSGSTISKRLDWRERDRDSARGRNGSAGERWSFCFLLPCDSFPCLFLLFRYFFMFIKSD